MEGVVAIPPKGYVLSASLTHLRLVTRECWGRNPDDLQLKVLASKSRTGELMLPDPHTMLHNAKR